MFDVVFVGRPDEAHIYRKAGITSFEPAPGYLAERILAERKRCRVIAMTADTLAALPAWLAGELREGAHPALAIVPVDQTPDAARRIAQRLRSLRPEPCSAAA